MVFVFHFSANNSPLITQLVKPLHVFLVLLGGTDITLDKLQGLDSPEDPTIVWHVLREINKSPVRSNFAYVV